MARRILVTGGSGFVGGYLLQALRDTAHPEDTIIIASRDAAPAGTPELYLQVDLSDPQSCASAVATAAPTHVIHLAARSSATGSNADPAGTWRNNLGTTQNLADAIAARRTPVFFLFASSAQIYGDAFGTINGPAPETLQPRPANPYARSKLSEEWLLRDMVPPGSRLAVLRLFNSTGPGQQEGFVLPDLAAQIARAEHGGSPVIRSGDATKERDFLDVRDTVAAFVAVLEAESKLPPASTFNIASGHPRSIRSLYEDLAAIASVPVTLTAALPQAQSGDVDRVTGDHRALGIATGWAPRISWADTVRDTLNWWRMQVAEASH